MTSVTLSNSITVIDEYTFSGCSSLESVIIPKGVTTVGYYAFANCYGLASVTIPTTVTSLAYYAFESCYHISSLTLIGEGEWQGGTIMIQRPVELHINSQITGVKGMYIKPSHVYCAAMTPPVCDSNSFTDYSGTLHVPASALATYQAAPYWKNFLNIIGDAVEATPGDVNGDGYLTINDVTAFINYLMTGDGSNFKAQNADINGDGEISIKDVTLLIEKLMHPND
jgi:hypothetical protein